MTPICIRWSSLVAAVAALVLASNFLASNLALADDAASKRLALVIANGDYKDASLQLPASSADADMLAEELNRDGFDVDLRKDLDLQGMRAAIGGFTEHIVPGSTALIYFNGVGVQVARETFLVPIDSSIRSEADVRTKSIALDETVAAVNRKGASVKIVVVDASRPNPIERRFRAYAAGLSGMETPEGTLAMFAAAPNKVIADDPQAAPSLFMSELVKELRAPDVSVEEALMHTRIGVSRASNGQQVPWVASSLVEPLYFTDPSAPAIGDRAAYPPPARVAAAPVERPALQRSAPPPPAPSPPMPPKSEPEQASNPAPFPTAKAPVAPPAAPPPAPERVLPSAKSAADNGPAPAPAKTAQQTQPPEAAAPQVAKSSPQPEQRSLAKPPSAPGPIAKIPDAPPVPSQSAPEHTSPSETTATGDGPTPPPVPPAPEAQTPAAPNPDSAAPQIAKSPLQPDPLPLAKPPSAPPAPEGPKAPAKTDDMPPVRTPPHLAMAPSVSIGGPPTTTPSPQPGPSQADPNFRDCADCPEMGALGASSFFMGDGATPFDRPVHRVTFAKAFAVGVTEVTFADWNKCFAAGGCKFKPDDQGFGEDQHPVINVSWFDTQDYLAWLSKTTGKPYRLPTEAEWEFAARAGTRTPYSWGVSPGVHKANCVGCGGDHDAAKTLPVRSFEPNRYGFYDMAGNVAEWVEDCWNRSYNGAPKDGSAWLTGDCGQRVLRGGSFDSTAAYAKPSSRFRYDADVRYWANGFRVARDLP